jgi:SAM-dependent methyltransferase
MLRPYLESAARGLWKLSMAGMPQGVHITRYSMYKALQSQASGLDFGLRVLSISHSNGLCRLLGIAQSYISEASYPEQNICGLSLPSETYSAVVSDQVLEHISCTPECAVDEVYRVLVPGGIAVHTTCFLAPYHGSPDFTNINDGDYWRFTPSGLQLLHQRYTRVIAVGGWGNPFMSILGGLGLTRMPIPEASWHPLNKLARFNRTSYAFSVWVVAQK